MKSQQISLSRYVAFFAIIIAITVVSLVLPAVFLIPLLLVAICFRFEITMLTALIFGLISYLLSFAGGGFVPLAFIEQPLIPIIPRLIVGLTTYGSFHLINNFIKKDGKLKKILPKAVAAGIGSITNTVFVIMFMFLLLPRGFSASKSTLKTYLVFMIGSGCIELVINVVVLPPLAIAVSRILKRTKFNDMMSKDNLIYTKSILNNESGSKIENENCDMDKNQQDYVSGFDQKNKKDY